MQREKNRIYNLLHSNNEGKKYLHFAIYWENKLNENELLTFSKFHFKLQSPSILSTIFVVRSNQKYEEKQQHYNNQFVTAQKSVADTLISVWLSRV